MVVEDSFCKLRKVIDDNQDAPVTIVRRTDFQVIVLYQLVKVPTLDGIVRHRFITHLLASQTLADIVRWY